MIFTVRDLRKFTISGFFLALHTDDYMAIAKFFTNEETVKKSTLIKYSHKTGIGISLKENVTTTTQNFGEPLFDKGFALIQGYPITEDNLVILKERKNA